MHKFGSSVIKNVGVKQSCFMNMCKLCFGNDAFTQNILEFVLVTCSHFIYHLTS